VRRGRILALGLVCGEYSANVDLTVMSKSRVKSRNGDLFIVYNEGRRVGLGLIARGNNRPVRLGYFFPLELFDGAPDKANLSLNRKQSVLVRMFGDLEIVRGNWPIVGHLQDFTPETWPMPKFERFMSGSDGPNTRIITEYDEERLAQYVFESEASRLPKDYDLSFVVEEALAGAYSLAYQLEEKLSG
jgi:Immunity protein 26